MKVVHVNMGCAGGAAAAALRLHRGLLLQGVDSTFLNLKTDRPEEHIVQYRPPPKSLVQKFERRWRLYRNAAYQRELLPERSGFERLSLDCTDLVPDLSAALGDWDVVHLHTATGVVDFQRTLGGIARRGQGLAWTLHDMNPFTGGCHYDQDCGRYQTGCGACPALGSAAPDDLTSLFWRRKRAALARLDPSRVRLVSPSRWLGEAARRSPLLGRFPLSIIPYGLDTGVFHPVDPAEARAAFGLPADARIVLLVADNLEVPRKGFDLLRQALETVAREVPRLLLLCAGAVERPLAGNCVFLGRLDQPHLLRQAYGAADLLAVPSLQDNLPNTAMEAMAVGLPVVGFAAGGIPDMVRAGESGITVPTGDVPALAAALRLLLEDGPERRRLGRRAREIVEKEYTIAIQAQALRNLYRTLLS